MNWQLSFWIFGILSVFHCIGDFGTPYRRFGISNWNELKTRQGWKKFLLSEWVLTLNIMHFIWDKWSPLRRHQNYVWVIPEKDIHDINIGGLKKGDIIISWWFWRWLAVDQLYHVLSNLFLAWLIGMII